jgi:hypothetical protein
LALFGGKENENKPDASGEDQSERKQSEVRRMSGFDTIDEVAEAARKRTSGEEEAASRARGKSRIASARNKRQEEEAKAAKEAADRQKAREVVGKHLMNKLANIPYDAWAAYANDPRFKLSAEESKELADGYYLLATSLDLNFNSPLWLFLGVAFYNIVLVAERLPIQAEADARAAQNKEKTIEGEGKVVM